MKNSFDSGRDYSAIQYTFYDDNVPDVLFKNDAYGTCNLKKRNTENDKSVTVAFSPNPFSENLVFKGDEKNEYNITFSDITGKVVFATKGKPSEINDIFKKNLSALKSGIYYCHIIENSENKNFSLIKIQ